MFEHDYMLALSEVCGWLSQPGYDSYSEDGESVSGELREAAREWWDELNGRVASVGEVDGAIYRAIRELADPSFGFNDGQTSYFIVHHKDGWFIFTEGIGFFIEYITDEDVAELPDLSAIQQFDVKFEARDSYNWVIVFGETKEAE